MVIGKTIADYQFSHRISRYSKKVIFNKIHITFKTKQNGNKNKMGY